MDGVRTRPAKKMVRMMGLVVMVSSRCRASSAKVGILSSILLGFVRSVEALRIFFIVMRKKKSL